VKGKSHWETMEILWFGAKIMSEQRVVERRVGHRLVHGASVQMVPKERGMAIPVLHLQGLQVLAAEVTEPQRRTVSAPQPAQRREPYGWD
jgi:hypothetical protein